MGDFVRGGQLTLHSVRMVRQVMYFLWVIGLLILLLSVPVYVYSNTTDFERDVALKYYLATFKVSTGKGDEKLAVTRISGQEDEIRASRLVTHPPVKGMAEHVWQVFYDGLILVLTAISFLFVGIVGYFISKGRRLGSPGKIRGAEIANVEELKARIAKDNKKAKANSYQLAGVEYPAHSESQHTWITGGPGSGKTVVLSDLISQIRKRGDRAIIYDRTGSYIKWFYDQDKDVILNPLDARSVPWSVFNEGTSASHFDTMAAALMPTEKGTVDPFWTNAARVIFSSVCSQLAKQGTMDNKTLLNNLLKTDLEPLAKLVKGTPAQAIIDEQSPKTALSVMSVISTNVGAMKFLSDGDGAFSIRDWIKDETTSNFMFVSSRADQHASIRPLISTWLEIAINALLSLDQSRDRRIWVILDELPSLHYLPSLQAGLAESRQFGGAFVLGLQVMPQLQAIYGHDVARATSGLCQTRLVFKSADADTARMSADSLGSSETEEFKEGLSYGAHEMRDGININTQRSLQNLILPTQVMNLPNLTAYIRFGMDYPVAKVDIDYVPGPVIAQGFEPAMTKEDTSQSDDTSDPSHDVKSNDERQLQTDKEHVLDWF